ncbi:hypothetical protein AAVH_21533 [Aphelenchoides avenae]|nr:hypothetical protein AAVH_21533 [Aphelenchus avenae]
MTSYYLWRLRSELIEMLREKIYFVKENLANASYFPSTNQYFYNVSDIIYTYNHFFLLEEPRREYIANETLKKRRIETVERMLELIDFAARTTDEQPMPFGGRECGLLPPELRKYTAPNYTVSDLKIEILPLPRPVSR